MSEQPQEWTPDPTSFVPIEDQIELQSSKQPQEWTDEYVRELYATSVHGVVAAHNAALAAERENVKDAQDEAFAAHAEGDSLREQLAAEREAGVRALAERSFELHAEREKAKRAEQYLQKIFGITPDALAKVKEGQ